MGFVNDSIPDELLALLRHATVLGSTLLLVVVGTVRPSTPVSANTESTNTQGRLVATPRAGADAVGRPAHEIDPTAFDLVATTDTEVDRLQTQLDQGYLTTIENHRLAATTLTEREGKARERRAELDDANDALAHIERVIAETAIATFKTDTLPPDGVVPGPDLDAIAEGTVRHLTQAQLGEERTEAKAAVGRAVAALSSAERSVRAAAADMQAARDTSDQAQSLLADFEQRAADHQRLGTRADHLAATRSDTVPLRSVAGTLVVNLEIEDVVDRLLADARQDGIFLAGGGYRSEAEQIALRLAHCDDSHHDGELHADPSATDQPPDPHHEYVVYGIPAEACAPPTAPPGKSEHQTGLAIDFTEHGQVLTVSSPGFSWLQDHGASYGLMNLAGEPWHWSTTGR